MDTFAIICTLLIILCFIIGVYDYISKKRESAYFASPEFNKELREEKRARRDKFKKECEFIGGYTSIYYYHGNCKEHYFAINEETKQLCVDGYRYNFDEILDYKIVDHVSNESYIVTDDGNLIKRALVGGVIGGGVGAAIGASTAKKQIQTIPSFSFRQSIVLSTSRKYHDDNERSMYFDESSSELKDIVMVLKPIVDYNKEYKRQKLENQVKSDLSLSVADELTKLAELKKQGFLSDEEFNQQKTKLLNK